jgi:hypothetical protein
MSFDCLDFPGTGGTKMHPQYSHWITVSPRTLVAASWTSDANRLHRGHGTGGDIVPVAITSAAASW